MTFKIDTSSINKGAYNRKAHILKPLLRGGILMQAFSLVSESASMKNFFGIYTDSVMASIIIAVIVAFGMELLIRGILVYVVLELYHMFKPEEDEKADDENDIIDYFVIIISVLTLLGLVYTSVFVSKKGTHSSFKNSGEESIAAAKQEKLYKLEEWYTDHSTEIKKEYEDDIAENASEYNAKITAKIKSFSAQQAEKRLDSIYYSTRTRNGKNYASRLKKRGLEIQELENNKQIATSTLLGQKTKFNAPILALKVKRIKVLDEEYTAKKEEIKKASSSKNNFVNLFSKIISFIAGYSVIFFLAFHTLYVLVMLKIGFKPAVELDDKKTRLPLLDSLQNMFQSFIDELQNSGVNIWSNLMEFIPLFEKIISKYMGWFKGFLDFIFIGWLGWIKGVFETKSTKSETTKESVVDDDSTTESTTKESVVDDDSTTKSTTKESVVNDDSTTESTTKKSVVPKKSVATISLKGKKKNVNYLEIDVVSINGLIYGMWRGTPRAIGFLNQQVINNEGFLSRKDAGRSMKTVAENIEKLNKLIEKVEKHMKKSFVKS